MAVFCEIGPRSFFHFHSFVDSASFFQRLFTQVILLIINMAVNYRTRDVMENILEVMFV